MDQSRILPNQIFRNFDTKDKQLVKLSKMFKLIDFKQNHCEANMSDKNIARRWKIKKERKNEGNVSSF